MSESLQKSEKEKYTTIWKYNEYRLYSPGEASIKNLRIINLLRRCGVKTVLDAGCGSGKLMRALIEECGIPTEKVELVLDNFYRCTKKICYLSIALQHDYFGPKIIGKPLHLTVKEPNWWISKVKKAGFNDPRYVTEKDRNGHEIWLHIFLLSRDPH